MTARKQHTSWHLTIDRVVVTGVTGNLPDSNQLRALIESHVAAAATDVTLPQGRVMRLSLQIDARSLSGGEAIASAVASSVRQAVNGGRSRA